MTVTFHTLTGNPQLIGVPNTVSELSSSVCRVAWCGTIHPACIECQIPGSDPGFLWPGRALVHDEAVNIAGGRSLAGLSVDQIPAQPRDTERGSPARGAEQGTIEEFIYVRNSYSWSFVHFFSSFFIVFKSDISWP